MTREEAIGHIKDIICENNTIKPNIVVFEQEKEALYMAIEALEQENVLDEMFENIKTEIDFIPTYGAKFADGSINVHVNKKDVLQIIDKYRGESDCRECKVEHDCYECKKYAESEES